MANMQAVPAQPSKPRWGLRVSLVLAAITAILIVAVVWLTKDDRRERRDVHRLQARFESAQATESQDAEMMRAYANVIAAPDTVSVTLQQQAGGPPGQAHVLYNARLGLAVYSGQISPPPAGKSYQLWLVPSSGAPVNAGLIAANQQNGAVVAHLDPALPAKAFEVTVEPQGGQTQPTGPKVLMGTVNG